MKLAADSHQRIERFLRDHLQRERLMLPPVFVYSGRGARWLTGTFNIVAITFGRRVFIAPRMVTRDNGGRVTVPAKLIAHEVTHVVQYQQSGFLGFLCSYLGEYWRALNSQPGWGKAARQAAYMAIRHEREANQAENAYPAWNPPEGAT